MCSSSLVFRRTIKSSRNTVWFLLAIVGIPEDYGMTQLPAYPTVHFVVASVCAFGVAIVCGLFVNSHGDEYLEVDG